MLKPDAIASLLDEFFVEASSTDAHSMSLRKPLGGFFGWIKWPIISAAPGQTAPAPKLGTLDGIRRNDEAEHYLNNIQHLIRFLWEDLEAVRGTRDDIWPKAIRLGLDTEKLLTDCRSYMDARFQSIVPFQRSLATIPKKRRESLGKFADWWENEGKPMIEPPLGIITAFVPWVQAVRRLRDNYTHHGHQNMIFPDPNEVLFSPHMRAIGSDRTLPDALYSETNPNNLLRYEAFIAFVVAPVFFLDGLLGYWLQDHLIPEKERNRGVGFLSLRTSGGSVKDLHDLLRRNQDLLANGNMLIA